MNRKEEVKWGDVCPMHPSESSHECMIDERKCVYCGKTIQPYQCNGCGQFLSTKDMHEDCARCESCQ